MPTWTSRKCVLAIVAGIVVACHPDTADDLFGGAQGNPRTDKMIAAVEGLASDYAHQICGGSEPRWRELLPKQVTKLTLT